MLEDEMVGWHHQLNGHESEQTLGDSEGQGILVCCSRWGCKEVDRTQQVNNYSGYEMSKVIVLNLETRTGITVLESADSCMKVLFFFFGKCF